MVDWNKRLFGSVMYWEFYPQFVFCEADWFSIINAFNQVTNKTVYVLVSLAAVFVSLRKRYVTRQRLLQGQGSEPRASVTCITQKREQFDDSIWYWGLKKTQTILNNIIYFHCSGSRPRYKDEVCRKNFKHNKPIFFVFTLISVSEIHTAFLLSPEEFKTKYGIPKPKVTDDNLIFHCQSGRRAKKAVEEVQQLGYERYVIFGINNCC